LINPEINDFEKTFALKKIPILIAFEIGDS